MKIQPTTNYQTSSKQYLPSSHHIHCRWSSKLREEYSVDSWAFNEQYASWEMRKGRYSPSWHSHASFAAFPIPPLPSLVTLASSSCCFFSRRSYWISKDKIVYVIHCFLCHIFSVLRLCFSVFFFQLFSIMSMYYATGRIWTENYARKYTLAITHGRLPKFAFIRLKS